MKCLFLCSIYVQLAIFILFIICSPGVNLNQGVEKNNTRVDIRGDTRDEIRDEANLIKSDNILESLTIEPSELINKKKLIKFKTGDSKSIEKTVERNYSILIACIAICGGFILAIIFLLVALLYNKKTMSEISNASIHIVKSLNEATRNKVSTGDVLTMHI